MEANKGQVFAPNRILVIDDSPTARAKICATLRGAGYEVVELGSAIGATRTVLREQVRAVVADVSMPGLTGDKLVAVLRRTPRLNGLPIVLVSGESDEELARIRREEEVDEVIPKHALEQMLLPVLSRLLRVSQA